MFYIELETTAKYQSILNEKMKFSIKNFFSTCDTADLVTFTEEIVNGRLFFCAAILSQIGIRKLQNITVQVKLLFHKLFI